jgi:predicted component of type VI protein secretion system
MKLELVVLSPGKMQGKSIPVTLNQFLVGRDPQCHLRPASAMISKRHCAIMIRDEQAFVRDFGSTNGTAVNGEAIQGERELHNEDLLKVGPLEFRVHMEATAPVSTLPPPRPAQTGASDDEAAAAVLLSLQDDSGDSPDGSAVDSDGVPTGSTVMETMTPQDGTPAPGNGKAAPDKAKVASGNTSSAAKEILEKYMRRPRRS